MTGAMLTGREDFIQKASTWQRRLGGNPYTLHPFALSCRAAFRAHAGSFEQRWAKTKAIAAAVLGAAKASECEDAVFLQPAEPACAQVQCFLRGDAATLGLARDALQERTGERLFGGVRPVLSHLRKDLEAEGRVVEDWNYFEMTVGPQHLKMDDLVFRKAWEAFFRSL
jgi:hypothetical protein